MRRAPVIALTLGLTLVPASAIAAPMRSSCADILDAAGSYQGAAPTFRLDLNLKTASPACSSATFTIYVLDDPPTGAAEPIALLVQESRTGDGATDSIRFSLSVLDDDETVCLWATSRIRTRSIDRAPDSGCAPLTAPTTFSSLVSFD